MRRATIIGLAFALVTGVGATCRDTGGGPHNDPFPPPVEAPKDDRPTCPGVVFATPDERCFILQTFVESRLGPYDVYLHITGVGEYPPHLPIAAGGWKHSVKYRAGARIVISLTLELDREGSRDGYCSITDGLNVVKDEIGPSTPGGRSPYLAICQTTTSQ